MILQEQRELLCDLSSGQLTGTILMNLLSVLQGIDEVKFDIDRDVSVIDNPFLSHSPFIF